MLTPLPHPASLIATVALFAAIVLFAGVGGMLIASAWRGRLMGWAPTCAKCRFDLRASAGGLPEHCPECGTLLAGAVEVGPRSMRRRRMVVGLVLLLLSGTLAVGVPMGAPRSINNWFLSKRSLESLAPQLDAGDSRAWRVALDRVRMGSPTEREVDFLLERILDQIRTRPGMSMSERMSLTTLAQSSAAPADLPQRVLDALASVPNAVRLIIPSSTVDAGGNLAVTAAATEWPTIPGHAIQLLVEDIVDAAGKPLRGLIGAGAFDTSRLPRGMISTRLVFAPKEAGDHQLRVTIALRAVGANDEVLWEKRVEQILNIRVEPKSELSEGASSPLRRDEDARK